MWACRHLEISFSARFKLLCTKVYIFNLNYVQHNNRWSTASFTFQVSWWVLCGFLPSLSARFSALHSSSCTSNVSTGHRQNDWGCALETNMLEQLIFFAWSAFNGISGKIHLCDFMLCNLCRKLSAVCWCSFQHPGPTYLWLKPRSTTSTVVILV